MNKNILQISILIFSSIQFSIAQSQCTTLVSTNSWTPVEVIPGFFGEAGDSLLLNTFGVIDSVSIHHITGNVASAAVEMYLESPEGTVESLVLPAAGCFNNIPFDFGLHDGATTTVSGCLPSSGYYKPAGNLTNFSGEQGSGHWKFWVSDGSQQNGTISGWSLEICYTPSDPIIDCPLNIPDSNCFYYPTCEYTLKDVPNISPFSQFFAIQNDQFMYTINHGLMRYDVKGNAKAQPITTYGDPYTVNSNLSLTNPLIDENNMVWQTNENNIYNIWLLDLSTDSLQLISEDNNFYSNPILSDSIIAWNHNGSIEYYNTNTENIEHVFTHPPSPYSNNPHPITNGRYIVWRTYTPGLNMWTLNLHIFDIQNPIPQGTIIETITGSGFLNVGPLHFEGDIMAYRNGTNNTAEIRYYNFNDPGSGVQQLTNNSFVDGDISVNNNKLLWVTQESQNWNLMSYDFLNPNNLPIVIDSFVQIRNPVQQGSFIAFYAYDGTQEGIYIYDRNRPELGSQRIGNLYTQGSYWYRIDDGLLAWIHGELNSERIINYYHFSTLEDNDSDGYCGQWDCDDSDASIYYYASCDDMNTNTSGDSINENCVCTGDIGNLAYVDWTATGENSGVSWEHAFSTLQDALALPNIDTVMVAEGVYYPDEIDGQDLNDVTESFIVGSEQTILGGFPSGGGPLQNRKPGIYKTILSGDIHQDDHQVDNIVYHIDSIVGTNSQHIIKTSLPGHITVDGFVVTGGQATTNGGGGLLGTIPNNYFTVLRIRNCGFYGNQSSQNGGAISLSGASSEDAAVQLFNCIFSGNHSDNSGGAIHYIEPPIFFGGGYLLVYNCTFFRNSATQGFSSINIAGDKMELKNNIVWDGINPITSNGQPVFAGNNLSDDPGVGSTAYPEFLDTINHDIHVSMNSPAVNGGVTFSLIPTIDLDGNPRIGNDTIDIGPYELTEDCIHPDNIALYSFYIQTNGDSWTTNTNWLTDCDPCNWHGIDCDINDRVISIELQVNNVSGTLPPEITQLSYLRDLKLGVNNITGNIPTGLGAMTDLQNVWLHLNNFTNTIPVDVGNSSSLQRFYVNNNPNLIGSLPASLGDISSLLVLQTNGTGIAGYYPGNLQNLCTQLGTYSTNANISDSTGLNAAWEDFCACQAGIYPCDEVNVWQGGVDDWSIPANWSLGHVPRACESVLINMAGDQVTVPVGEYPVIYLLEVIDGAELIIPIGQQIRVLADPDFSNYTSCE